MSGGNDEVGDKLFGEGVSVTQKIGRYLHSQNFNAWRYNETAAIIRPPASHWLAGGLANWTRRGDRVADCASLEN